MKITHDCKDIQWLQVLMTKKLIENKINAVCSYILEYTCLNVK